MTPSLEGDAVLSQIATAIRQGSTFLVVAHASPDGDAIASTLALSNALREMGKKVIAYNADPVPQKLNFLPGAETVSTQLDAQHRFDVGVVLDAGELRRTQVDVLGICAQTINIDHHPHSEDFGDIYYVDTGASATAVLIYRILKHMHHPVSLAVAENIYTAILSDTGSFHYSSANSEAFFVSGEMVEIGVDPWKVAGGLYESQEAERLRLLASALATLQISACGRIATMYVTQQMFESAGAGPELADSFVNYPRSIQGVEVAVFLRELAPNVYKLGMRSKGKVDVGQLARDLNGGGHHNAAGAEVRGTLEQITTNLIKHLQPLLP
ncbi:MAG: bifunctional oligoribonuclease/PAP phosphatase NrnA [Desulfuromonadaceae bacterium]|nr:bifunctional oligoribonuclease/PAP phosphatase NrnA [Desulfuromonadaceae bacterium]